MLFTVEQAKQSLRILGLPINRDNLRRCARAKHLLDAEHVRYIADWSDETTDVYFVASQWGIYQDGTIYQVKLNGSSPSCDCPDKANPCKHIIAALMARFKAQHATNGKPVETVTFDTDAVTSLETKFIGIWRDGKYYSLAAHECEIEGNTVTMPKVIADRMGIDYRPFDPDLPENVDSDKFDWEIFRREASSYKLERLQAICGGGYYV